MLGGVERAACSRMVRASGDRAPRADEPLQRARYFAPVDEGPGGVGENEVERPIAREPSGGLVDLGGDDACSVVQTERGHVGPQGREGGPRRFDEDRVRGPA